MFLIIILILFVDTVMLCAFAIHCNRTAWDYLIPMYALQVVGYAALYRIYIKTKLGKKEKLRDKLERLRAENVELKRRLGEAEGNEAPSGS